MTAPAETASGAKRHFTVVGAGTVGVCTALSLQRDGHRVTLVDRIPPGRGCSYGNAGLVQTGACVPIATPGVLRQVPKMLLDPDQPLVIRWQYLPSLMPYLTRFMLAARPSRVEQISAALASILSHAADSYWTLAKAAGAEHLLKEHGELYVYETEAAYQRGKSGHDLRRRRGVEVVEIPREELRQLEPALGPQIIRGVLLPRTLKTANPFLFTTALAEHFVRDGGEVMQATVQDIEIGPGGPTAIVTDKGRQPVDGLVIAMGAYSKPWAKRLGAKIPLDTERGYHLMLPKPGIDVRQALISGDFRFAITPMVDGLRLAGTAELAKVDATPNYERSDRLLKLAQRLLPGLEGTDGERWMGHRPATPDSIPVIGRSPRFSSVYFAFGHGHLGLTMGGITGRLIADLAAGRTPPIDLAPFAPTRF